MRVKVGPGLADWEKMDLYQQKRGRAARTHGRHAHLIKSVLLGYLSELDLF
jgi:hypothetical protein